MKKVNFVSVAWLIMSLTYSKDAVARIWRINNNADATNGSNLGGTASRPVFQQLFGTPTNSASGSNLVESGDTVHLEGSPNAYTGGSLTKKLTIIGPGFFLDENTNTSVNALSAILPYITFNGGSSGSQLIGIYNGGNSNGIQINVSNIAVRRCRIDYGIGVSFNISDITIMQNFFARVSTASIIGTNSNGFPFNVVFDNNIVLGTFILPVGFTMGECNNNVFAGPSITGSPSIRMNTGAFQNNILTNPAATVDINGGTNLNVTYNTASNAAQFGTGTGNIVADMAALFVTTGTGDGKYQLKPGSAAGADGVTERGAYGGSAVINRYMLSGLAPIPVIYEIATSGVADASGLPVTIKARTIK